mgnify:CR=1 FL=1
MERQTVFQCHHGVPASPDSLQSRPLLTLISMPPRRSCFGPLWDDLLHMQTHFNATTAFLLRPRAGLASLYPTSFNATTAFLLLGRRRSGANGGSPVSMPPRRSCFISGISHSHFAFRFQCHHGVPASQPWKAEVR